MIDFLSKKGITESCRQNKTSFCFFHRYISEVDLKPIHSLLVRDKLHHTNHGK